MKKALDYRYVSDYQLKSACKDAICIALSKVTQMIFAVLEDWYHHSSHIEKYYGEYKTREVYKMIGDINRKWQPKQRAIRDSNGNCS